MVRMLRKKAIVVGLAVLGFVLAPLDFGPAIPLLAKARKRTYR
jgi:hypothetical protein